MPKYNVRQETDIWGNDKTVIRQSPTASDVGGAIGTGLALAVAARRNSQMKAVADAMDTAQKQLENGNYEAAIATCNTLIANKDREAQTVGHMFKARGLYGLGRYDQAIPEYTAAISMANALNQAEAVVLAFLERGICNYYNNDLSASMRDITSYIQAQPNDDNGYFWQGRALAKLGDLDQALTNLSKAVSINPGDAANYRERAII